MRPVETNTDVAVNLAGRGTNVAGVQSDDPEVARSAVAVASTNGITGLDFGPALSNPKPTAVTIAHYPSAQDKYEVGVILRKSGDLVNAKKWFLLATGQGHPEAWNDLGSLYWDLGERDVENVSRCYKNAAALGCPAGAFNMGQMLLSVKRDSINAHKWFETAHYMGSDAGLNAIQSIAPHLYQTHGFMVDTNPPRIEGAFGLKLGKQAPKAMVPKWEPFSSFGAFSIFKPKSPIEFLTNYTCSATPISKRVSSITASGDFRYKQEAIQRQRGLLQQLALKYGSKVQEYEGYRSGKYVNSKTIVLGPRSVGVGVSSSTKQVGDYTLTVTYVDSTLAVSLNRAERDSVTKAVKSMDGL